MANYNPMQGINDWYNNLVQQISSQNTQSIRNAGAQPNDPYFAAKKAQGMNDANTQRSKYLQQIQDNAWGNVARGNAEDAAYQKRVTAGIWANPNQGMRPDELLGGGPGVAP